MEHKLVDIEHRISGSYHEDQYLMDIFAKAEQSVCERFNNSVAQIKEDWINGWLDERESHSQAEACLHAHEA